MFVFSEMGLLFVYFSPALCSNNLSKAAWKECLDTSPVAAGGSGLGQEVCMSLVCVWNQGTFVLGQGVHLWLDLCTEETQCKDTFRWCF